MSNKENKDKRSLMNNIVFTLQHMFKWQPESMWLTLVNSIAVAIAPFIWVVVPKLIIDAVSTKQSTSYIITILLCTLIIASIVYFTKEACIGVYRMKMARTRMLFGLDLHGKAMQLDYHHVENVDTQNALHRAKWTTSNPQFGMGGVMQNTFSIVGYLLGFIGYLGIIFSLNPLVLIYLLFSVTIIYRRKDKANKFQHSKEDELRPDERKFRYLARIMTDFEFGKDIRIYQLKEMLLQKMLYFNRKTEAIQKTIYKEFLIVELLDTVLVLFRDGIVYGYITYLTLNGRLTFGDFILYTGTISGFAVWMQELMRQVTLLRFAARYVDDYRDYMEIDGNVVLVEPLEAPKGERHDICFKDICFKYPDSEKAVFDKFTLEIPAGQKLAIVGTNGAGKTSLIKLLTGLYRPNSGEIHISGTDIARVPLIEHYKLFSVVYQEIKPLAASIAENVASCESPDEAMVWDALKRSGLEKKVKTLGKSIDTELLKVIYDDGIELSGGENQKLALARALYKNGPIVILDEPTSALDPIAEKDIYESFNDMIGNRTAIFISHRLSSTKFCDKVVFIEDGKIIESGSHSELMALKGKYAHMFNLQAQYYQTQSEVSA